MKPSERSTLSLTDWAARLEIVPRLQAVLDELRVADGDLDVPTVLCESLLEDIEAAL